jgi:NADP-dependent 3-hydroxy acid dehydrogenase YdfG
VLVARRRDRLETLSSEIERAGGTALVVEADISDRTQAEDAVQQTVARFGRLDTLVNNAGLMLHGPVVGADIDEWDRMIAVNNQGLLYTTHAALPHLLKAAGDGPRQVPDIVNISSIAGRIAWNGYGVCSLTKFGVNGFTEALRQEVTQQHVRVGIVEPGGVDTELGSHNNDEVRSLVIDPFTSRPRSSPPRISPTESPTSSPGRATHPSASCGSCPPTKPERRTLVAASAGRKLSRSRSALLGMIHGWIRVDGWHGFNCSVCARSASDSSAAGPWYQGDRSGGGLGPYRLRAGQHRLRDRRSLR